jgi:DNA polymerase III delta prime subunit
MSIEEIKEKQTGPSKLLINANLNDFPNLNKNVELNDSHEFDNDSIDSDEDLTNKKLIHDIFHILPEPNEELIPSQPLNDQEIVVEEILKIVHAELADITAGNMLELTKTTNPNDELFTHIINVHPDAQPIKQKTRKIPFHYMKEFKELVLEMKAAGMVVDS